MMFVTLLLLNVVGEKFLSFLYLKNKVGQSGGKVNYYMKLKPETDLLILGNSRALYQIIPDSFHYENTYNLCHAGMDDCFQLGLLHYVLSHNKKPQTILLQIDPEFYSKTDQKAAFVSTDIQHLKYYYDKDSIVRYHINQMSAYEKYKNYIPLYKYNGTVISLFKNFLNSSKVGTDKLKGFTKVLPTKMDSINTVNAFNVNSPKQKYVYDVERTKYLFDIIAVCKQYNVQLICFTSPHYKYNKTYYAELKSNLDALFEQHQIRYIDFDENASLLSQIESPNYWKDHMHLNLRGGALESHYLANITDSISVIKK